MEESSDQFPNALAFVHVDVFDFLNVSCGTSPAGMVRARSEPRRERGMMGSQEDAASRQWTYQMRIGCVLCAAKVRHAIGLDREM